MKYEKEARAFVEAICAIASDDELRQELECYLARHFGPWLEKFASTPEDMAAEMEGFSTSYIPF